MKFTDHNFVNWANSQIFTSWNVLPLAVESWLWTESQKFNHKIIDFAQSFKGFYREIFPSMVGTSTHHNSTKCTNMRRQLTCCHHMMTIWVPHDCHMSVTWLSHVCHMIATCLSHDCCMFVTYIRSCQMTYVHECHISSMWLSHDCHMAALAPGMLRFRCLLTREAPRSTSLRGTAVFRGGTRRSSRRPLQ